MLQPGEFFGFAHAQFRSPEFTVTTVTHATARVVPRHVHAHPFFSMLLAGTYRERFGGATWDGRPLDMVLRPPQAEHCDEIGPRGATFLCVDVTQDYWDSLAAAGIRLERRAFESRRMSNTALRLLRAIHDRPAGCRPATEALVTEMIGEYAAEGRRPASRAPRWLADLDERLRADPGGARLSAIAAELGLHPVHVSRVFKRHHGVTLSQHLRELRLRRAARDLLATDEPIAALAGRHGFADQSHLTRALSRAAHWTPAGLRCACGRPHA
jgi:AraC family transcriptional regulator